MPQSLSRILVHIVFSTNHRTPNLTPEVREQLYPYVAKIVSEEGSHAIRVGGYLDHIHLLLDFGRNKSVAQIVQATKIGSTKWLRREWPFLECFSWQSGYAAFSARPLDESALIDYIANQDEHHRKWSFQDELRALLTEHTVDFDEKYLWE